MAGETVITIIGFQSTLSMRRANADTAEFVLDISISIHALHEESDFKPHAKGFSLCISIHALHEESEVQLDIFVRFLRRKPAA